MRDTVSALRDLFARAPVPYTSASSAAGLFGVALGGGGRSRGSELAQYGQLGTLFAIVSNLAGGTARAEWCLYRKRTDARRRYGEAQDDRIEVRQHQALKVLERPNPFMPRQEFVETGQQHVDLTGEAWIVVERVGQRADGSGGIPVGMWPVRPDRMAPVPDPEEFLSGYVYTGPDGEKIPLGIDEVIMIRMPDPSDPYRGLGPLASVRTDVEAARAATEWNRNFFRNSALPGGLIEVDKQLSDTEFATMLTRWRESHKGVSNAHRVGILEQGKWRDRQMSMRDMEFTALRGISREVIREAYSYPKFLLGEPEGSNRASAMAAEYVEARRLLVPRLERWKAALNYDFLPMFGAAAEQLEFDYRSPVPDDPEQDVALLKGRADAAAALMGIAGVKLDFDQVLEVVGLPPIDSEEATPPPALVPAPAPGEPPAEPGNEPPGDDDEAPEGVAARAREILRAGGLTSAIMNGHSFTEGRR
jgi:HK97 family phage portal protein